MEDDLLRFRNMKEFGFFYKREIKQRLSEKNRKDLPDKFFKQSLEIAREIKAQRNQKNIDASRSKIKSIMMSTREKKALMGSKKGARKGVKGLKGKINYASAPGSPENQLSKNGKKGKKRPSKHQSEIAIRDGVEENAEELEGSKKEGSKDKKKYKSTKAKVLHLSVLYKDHLPEIKKKYNLKADAAGWEKIAESKNLSDEAKLKELRTFNAVLDGKVKRNEELVSALKALDSNYKRPDLEEENEEEHLHKLYLESIKAKMAFIDQIEDDGKDEVAEAEASQLKSARSPRTKGRSPKPMKF